MNNNENNNSMLDDHYVQADDDSFYDKYDCHQQNRSPNKLSTVLGDITNLSDTNLLKSSSKFAVESSISPLKDDHFKRKHRFQPTLSNMENNQQLQDLANQLDTPDNNTNSATNMLNSIFTKKYLLSNRSGNLRDERSTSNERLRTNSLSHAQQSRQPQLLISNQLLITTNSQDPGSSNREQQQNFQHVIDEKNKVIDALRRELTHNIRQIEKLKETFNTEKKQLIEEYEKKIEETRRDTRDKVQKVYEKRYNKKSNNLKSNPVTMFAKNAMGITSNNYGCAEETINSMNSETVQRNNSMSARVHTNESTNKMRLTMHLRGKSGEFNSHRTLKSSRVSKPSENTLTNLHEVTFKDPRNLEDIIRTKEKHIREQISNEYEELLRERTQETRIELQKKIRESVDQELRLEYMAQLKTQREIIRKEVRDQVLSETQERVDKEVERRLHDNMIEWEEEYKRKKINQIKEQARKEMLQEYEFKLKEIVEKEREKMEEQCQDTINENIRIAREEAERVIQERINQMQEEFERNLENERIIIRAECLEEIRGERELEIQQKLRERLTKKIEEELYRYLPKEVEQKVRGEIQHRIIDEIKENNEKQLGQIKRKIELERQDKEEAMKTKLRRDFDYEVRMKSEELSRKKEKDIVKKYKQMFEKEKSEMEEKLKKEFDMRLREVKFELEKEKNEAARLKSVEQIRLKKLNEQKKEMEEHIRFEKLEVERQKVRIEYQMKEQKVKDLEKEERKLQSRDRTPGRGGKYLNTSKILEKDEGCEKMSKNYHVSVNKPSILKQQEQPIINIQQQQRTLADRSKSPLQKQIIVQQLNPQSVSMQLYPVQLSKDSKESTFNPSLNPCLIPQVINSSGEEFSNFSQLQSNRPSVQEQETEQDEEETNRSELGNGIAQNRQYIKPYDSRSLVKKLLKESVQKFHLQTKLSSQPTLLTPKYTSISNDKENFDDSNQQPSLSTYDQILRGKNNGISHCASTLTSLYLMVQSEKGITNPIEYKMILQQFMDKEAIAEREFDSKKHQLLGHIEQTFAQNGMSDHGMCEYLLDLWEQLMISYQQRIGYLQSLQMREAKQIYRLLEAESAALADYKNETIEICRLIRKKESSFGNLFSQKYRSKEHKSELFGMRAEIIRKIEEYKRKRKGQDILWRGISYIDICKLEKQDIEIRMKEDIREEMENRKLQRATGQSTYYKILN